MLVYLTDVRGERVVSIQVKLDQLTQANFRFFIQVLLGGAGGARTHDRRIMRKPGLAL
jgi:hypothetical protein